MPVPSGESELKTPFVDDATRIARIERSAAPLRNLVSCPRNTVFRGQDTRGADEKPAIPRTVSSDGLLARDRHISRRFADQLDRNEGR
jgi:hypothetical protein